MEIISNNGKRVKLSNLLCGDCFKFEHDDSDEMIYMKGSFNSRMGRRYPYVAVRIHDGYTERSHGEKQ